MKQSVLILLLFFFIHSTQAQVKVGGDPVIINSSAIFEIESSDKGVLFPRVALNSLTDVTSIPNPSNSLTIFNTATVGTAPNNITPGYYYWSTADMKWIRLIDKEADLRLVTGSSHITQDAGTGSNGTNAGTGARNVFIGNNVGNDITTGSNNIGIGGFSLNTLTNGSNNTAIGINTLRNNNSTQNVAIGNGVLQANTTGSSNTSVGERSQMLSTTGASNTALGDRALQNNLTGSNNTAVGALAGANLTEGTGNIFIGNNAQPNVAPTANNQLNIGNWIFGDNGNIGIGKAVPATSTPDVTRLVHVAPPASSTSNRSTELLLEYKGPTISEGGIITGQDMAINDADKRVAQIILGKTTSAATTNANGRIRFGVANAGVLTTMATLTPTGFAVTNLNTSPGLISENVVVTSTTGLLKSVSQTSIAAQADVRAVDTRSHITQDAGANGSEGITSGGSNNILLGAGAGNAGNSNTALGSAALNNVTQSYNIGIGNSALREITASTGNIALGFQAAHTLIDGNNSIFIGHQVQPNVSTTASNQLNIGNWIYGNAGLIGLGTAAANPTQRLDVANGNLRVRDINLPANAGALADKIVVANGDGIFKTVDRSTFAADLRLVGTNNHITQDAGVGGTGTSAGTGGHNVMIGLQAGNALTTGADNIGIGRFALQNVTTASNNTAVGTSALSANTGVSNTAFGAVALSSNTTGTRNTSVGERSLATNTTGVDNTAVGSAALRDNTTGSSNVAIGRNTLDENLTGIENLGAGNNALGANTVGNYNVAVGNNALAASTASNNTALGQNAGANNVTGSSNVFIGQAAGNNSTGNFNTMLGRSAGTQLTSGASNIFLGYNIQPNVSNTASNQLNIGNWIYGNAGLIGLGTDAANPTQRLDVANGNLRVRDINLPANEGIATDRVVVADGTGIFKSVDRASLVTNIYNANGTLTANRVVTTNNNTLRFVGNENFVQITNIGTEGRMVATGTGRGSFSATGGNSILDVYADNNNTAQVVARGTTNTGLHLRTEGATSIRFSTFNSEKMRLLANGKLGIGTLTPSENVDINGVARVRNLPLNGTANAISTTVTGEAAASQNQTFTASRTVVADENGVLGSVEGIPSQAGTSRVVLSATAPGNQDISNGTTASTGIFSIENIDLFNAWANNFFTVPETGLYVISMQSAHEKSVASTSSWFNISRLQRSVNGGANWNNLMVDTKSNNSPGDVNNGNIIQWTGILNQGELIRIAYVCNATQPNIVLLGSLTITKLNQ
ncbi:hypothetical protein MM236_19350 [Belliella sp. DSM 107340]|uniref:C1q domain-containing protein n=1 Tax=Belliella calami TaxID=2923436 RepID=A0ABS9UUH4_9BACT|nr:hypothetical protein [Belliella calami]MCH7400159.1 hypothetical protein [Belliella calami]